MLPLDLGCLSWPLVTPRPSCLWPCMTNEKDAGETEKSHRDNCSGSQPDEYRVTGGLKILPSWGTFYSGYWTHLIEIVAVQKTDHLEADELVSSSAALHCMLQASLKVSHLRHVKAVNKHRWKVTRMSARHGPNICFRYFVCSGKKGAEGSKVPQNWPW